MFPDDDGNDDNDNDDDDAMYVEKEMWPIIPMRPITETRMPSQVYLYHSTTSKLDFL